jgi:hypothetical protein
MFECTMGINSCRSAFVKPSLLMTYAHPRRGKELKGMRIPMVSASTLFHRSIFRPAECAAARSRSRPHPPLLQAAAPCCGMHAMVANSASTDRAAGHGARLWGREARTFICLKMVDLPLSPAPSRSIFTGCARSKRGVRYRADGKCSVRLLRGMVRLKSKAAAARVCILPTRRLPLPIHLPGSRVRHNQQRIRSG